MIVWAELYSQNENEVLTVNYLWPTFNVTYVCCCFIANLQFSLTLVLLKSNFTLIPLFGLQTVFVVLLTGSKQIQFVVLLCKCMMYRIKHCYIALLLFFQPIPPLLWDKMASAVNTATNIWCRGSQEAAFVTGTVHWARKPCSHGDYFDIDSHCKTDTKLSRLLRLSHVIPTAQTTYQTCYLLCLACLRWYSIDHWSVTSLYYSGGIERKIIWLYEDAIK